MHNLSDLVLPDLMEKQFKVPGMVTPTDIYCVLATPAMLGGCKMPDANTNFKALHEMGFRYIVNLAENKPSYNPHPLQRLVCAELQNHSHSDFMPFEVEREENKIREIVDLIIYMLEEESAVLVHCFAGKGRTGTVLACVLKVLGYDSKTIIHYLDALHKRRGKTGWPESKYQSNLVENFC